MTDFLVYLNGKEAHNLFLVDKSVSAGTELCFFLLLNEDTVIDSVDIVFPLNEFSENTLVFNNGFCTNDFVNVIKLPDEPLYSRDIIMLKDGEKYLSIGMTTAETFLTRFITTKESLTLRYYFENKTYKAGKYALEQFVLSEDIGGGEFFSLYCDHLKEKHHIVLPKKIDTGWSSWSCLYGFVTEDHVKKQSDNMKEHFPTADLMQIDDGWQNGGTFCWDWTNQRETFASGIEALSAYLKNNGQRLGLWFSPTMFANTAQLFKEHYDYNIIYENGEIMRSFGGNEALCADNDGSVFPVDLENPNVLKHIEDSFKNAVENYDCHYFKIDFLVRSLIRCYEGKNLSDVTYHNEPAVKVYRNAMRRIRNAVGDDVFLMACGAPITESIGIFNAIRTSPDITWCSKGPDDRVYSYWEIVERDIQNVLLRSYYNNKVFLVDADALIVRNEIGVRYDDFTPTLEEARTWATTVALSGGAILVNEELEKLPEERLELIRQVIKPIGITAYPEDFFELPKVSRVCLTANSKRIKAVYNWDTEEKETYIRNDQHVFAFDSWSKEFIGEYKNNVPVSVAPHGVRAVLLVPVPSEDTVLAYTDDFYMGIDKKLTEKENAFKFTLKAQENAKKTSTGYIIKL